jgi:GNAT superfamily N-acetyltransferase
MDSREPDLSAYKLRMAVPSDAPLIARHRAQMFLDMGDITSEEYELLRRAAEPWLASHLASAAYVGWIVEHNGLVIAGGGAFIQDMGPRPGLLRCGRAAHVVNVFTERPYRRRGIARMLMNTMLEWCEAHSLDQVTLAASEEGRPLYESLGFTPYSGMKLTICSFRG